MAHASKVHLAAQPQKRARVMMKFVDLLNRDMQKLAEMLSSEHGKTVPDAKGDVQRGLEVAEFCIGAPHLLKGEFTEGAGPGIDMHSVKQPLGVVAGITPFNFPAMIPMWKFCPAIMAIGFVGSTPIAEYVYTRGCANGKRVQCFGGAKNHMIIMPDADMELYRCRC